MELIIKKSIMNKEEIQAISKELNNCIDFKFNNWTEIKIINNIVKLKENMEEYIKYFL